MMNAKKRLLNCPKFPNTDEGGNEGDWREDNGKLSALLSAALIVGIVL